MPTFKINTRFSKIYSCILEKEDISQLHNLLDSKVNEALQTELEDPKKFENKTQEQANEIRNGISESFKLSVTIMGSKGEILMGDDNSIFNEENFPNKIDRIIFDSSYYFKYFFGQEPLNRLAVQLDFKKQKILNFSNPTTEPDPNESSISVSGQDKTWVNGVYTEIIDFFKDKKTKRDWLHKKYIYEPFLYFLFLPITFWIIYRFSKYLQGSVQTVFLVGICVYIFFIVLIFMRILFNYSRWIFPLVEYSPKAGTKIKRHRNFLSVILLGLLISLVYDLIKTIL